MISVSCLRNDSNNVNVTSSSLFALEEKNPTISGLAGHSINSATADAAININDRDISFIVKNNHNHKNSPRIFEMIKNNSSSSPAYTSSFSSSIISQMLLISTSKASSSSSPSDIALTPEHEITTTTILNSTIDPLFTTTENDTAIYWPLRDPLYIVIPITVIYILILVIGLLGNIVTCVVIVRSRYLHTATNYYLFSLAVSDLLLLLSGLPAEMLSIWQRYPDVLGEKFCIAKGLASETSANASIIIITAFTIERWLAICHPFTASKWQNKLSRVVKQILVIWVISIALAIPQALQFGLVSMPVSAKEEAMICSVKRIVIEHSFEIATFVFFVGPMILITVLYCLIGFTLYNSSHSNESKLRLRKSLSSHKREAGQQRVLKMLVAVVVAFFVCWAPFHAQRLIAIWGVTWLESSTTLKNIYHTLIYISGVLYYVSTCINPILYHIMSLKFRHAFQVMVEGVCSDSFGMNGEAARRSQNQNLMQGVFYDRNYSQSQSQSQSISRSTRSISNQHPILEITMSSISTSQQLQNGKVCYPQGNGHSYQQSTQQFSYPQRINFVKPCVATIV